MERESTNLQQPPCISINPVREIESPSVLNATSSQQPPGLPPDDLPDPNLVIDDDLPDPYEVIVADNEQKYERIEKRWREADEASGSGG